MWWTPSSDSEALAVESSFPLGELYRDPVLTSIVHGFGTVRLGASRSPLLVVDAHFDDRLRLVRNLLGHAPLAYLAFERLYKRFGAALFPTGLAATASLRPEGLSLREVPAFLSQCLLGALSPLAATLRQFVPYGQAQDLVAKLADRFVPQGTQVLFSLPPQPLLGESPPHRALALDPRSRGDVANEGANAHFGTALIVDDAAMLSTVGHLVESTPTPISELLPRRLFSAKRMREVGHAVWLSPKDSGFDIALIATHGKLTLQSQRALMRPQEGETHECHILRDGKVTTLGTSLGALQRVRSPRSGREWANCFVVTAPPVYVAKCGDSGACVTVDDGRLVGHLVGGAGYKDWRGRFAQAIVQDITSTVDHVSHSLGTTAAAIETSWRTP